MASSSGRIACPREDNTRNNRGTFQSNKASSACLIKRKIYLFLNSQEIETIHRVTEQRVNELNEQNEFLGHQIKNNKETEQAIAELNDRAVLLRSQNSRFADDVTAQANELITLKKTLRSLSHQLQRIRQKNRQLLIDVDEKTRSIETMKDEEKLLDGKLKKFANLNTTAQDRLNNLDEFVEVLDARTIFFCSFFFKFLLNF